jgi:hypothetical protein
MKGGRPLESGHCGLLPAYAACDHGAAGFPMNSESGVLIPPSSAVPFVA